MGRKGLWPVGFQKCSGNHAAESQSVVNAAQILDLPLMCVHTPADNLVVRYLDQLFAEKQPFTMGGSGSPKDGPRI